MESIRPLLRNLACLTLSLWMACGTLVHARVEPTGTGTPADQDDDEDMDKEDPAARQQFRLLSLTSGNRQYDPNDLVKAKAHVKAMAYRPSAWPQAQSAPTGTIMPLTAGIQSSDWTPVGPGNVGGRTRSLVVHPTNPDILYLGAVGGGLWKSLDGGASWTVLNDFMPSIAIGALVMDPKNPSILYAGTGESYPYDGLRGAGIFKTTDAGATWNQLASTAGSDFYYVNRLAVSPANSQILLACTQTGVWRSTDGGASWTMTLGDASTDVEWNPTDGNKVIVTGSQNASYWSTNAGVTWTASSGMPPYGRVELAVAKSIPTTLYASVNQNSGEVWRSTDGGHSFTLRNTGNYLLGSQGWYDNTIWVDPLNPDNLLVGGVGMSMSTDGGLTFQNVWVGDLHADQHYIIEVGGYSASNRGVYVTNDGGIFKTDDVLNIWNGAFWYSLNHGLGVTQFYAGAGNSDNGILMGGTQDNGTPRYNGTYDGWLDVIGSDGGWTAADPNPDPDGSTYWYGETQYWNTVRVKLDASGNPAGNVTLNGSDENQELFIPPMILDPNNPQRLYKGGGRLWRLDNARTADYSTPWTVVRPVGSTISAIAVAPGNSNIIWLGHSDGTVTSTSNGLDANPTWTQRGYGTLPYGYCTRVTVDPGNSNRVYATFGGFNGANVWKSEDGGGTWTDITANLPRVPVRSLVVNKWNTNRIYVGTEIGVFASETRGADWSPGNDGPANASVDELFWVGNRLIAATHGRGMFRITVNTPPTAAITVPVQNATFAAGANVAITATASDPDGSIAKVEFFRGATKISEDATSPYQATFGNAPAGSYALTARATDNDGGTFTSAAVNITVGGSGLTLPGRLQAEDYKAGGEGVGYHDLSAGNTGGQYKSDDVDIEATTDAGGGYNVGWIQAGEWLAYDANVATAGQYNLTARLASATAGTKSAVLSVDGANVATFSFTDASGWQSWKDVTVTGVNLTAGPHVLRLTMNSSDFNVNYLDVAAASNQPPIADAGADRTVSANTAVTLDGRGSSDPDNGPQALSFAWTRISGPAVTLSNANTSQPSFTPVTAGTYGFLLTVSDGAASAVDTVLVTVTSGGVFINLPGRLQAEDYKTGGEGTGYHDLSAGNSGGQYRTDNVDIEATTDAGGGYNVGWIQAGEWLAYDVNVTAAGSYKFTARLASNVAGTKTAVVSVDGANVATFSFTDASGWQSWKDMVVTGVNLTAGTHALRITMNSSDFNLNYLDVAAASNQLPVANAGADRTVNANTAVTLDGRGSSDPDNGPQPLSYAWSQVSGPAVTLSSANTSQPSFTPTTAGTYGFRLTVSDGAASATDDIQVTVNPAGVYVNLPGRLQAEEYKAGGEGVGYHDLTAGNTGGQYRTDNVDIEATSDAGGGYNVGWIQAGEWLAYDVNVTAAGSYTLTARLASANAGTKTLTLSVDGGAVATFNFTDASGWQSWKDVAVSGVNLTAGVHVVRLTMTTGNFNLNYLDVQSGPANQLTNGDFSNGIAGWQTYIASPAVATIANEAGTARMTISNQGVNPWDIQIYQPTPLTAGKAYTLEFDIKAEALPKGFRVVIEHNGDPWTKYFDTGYSVSSAADTWQHFTIAWTQSATDAGGRVVFDFGAANANDCWLDNVVLK